MSKKKLANRQGKRTTEGTKAAVRDLRRTALTEGRVQGTLRRLAAECPAGELGRLLGSLAGVESPIESLLALELRRQATWGGAWDGMVAAARSRYGAAGLELEVAPPVVTSQHPVSADGHEYRVDFMLGVDARVADPATGRGAAIHASVGIECDGRRHEETGQSAYDDARDAAILEELGIPVLRLPGSEVWSDAAGCAERVLAHVIASLPEPREVPLVPCGAGHPDDAGMDMAAADRRDDGGNGATLRISEWMWRRLGLEGNDLVTYAAIAAADSGALTVPATQGALTDLLEISRSTMSRSLARLCRRGLIEEGSSEPARGSCGGRRRVVYHACRKAAPAARASAGVVASAGGGGEDCLYDALVGAVATIFGADAARALVECVDLGGRPVPEGKCGELVRAYISQLLRTDEAVTPAVVATAWRNYLDFAKKQKGAAKSLLAWLSDEGNGNIAYHARKAEHPARPNGQDPREWPAPVWGAA